MGGTQTLSGQGGEDKEASSHASRAIPMLDDLEVSLAGDPEDKRPCPLSRTEILAGGADLSPHHCHFLS